VLAANVVGYARFIEAAKLEAGELYRSPRVETIDPTIISRRGETVKSPGYGFLAVFESPIDASSRAADLQQEIAIRKNGRRL
jgi:class 3 adenylate cyclase